MTTTIEIETSHSVSRLRYTPDIIDLWKGHHVVTPVVGVKKNFRFSGRLNYNRVGRKCPSLLSGAILPFFNFRIGGKILGTRFSGAFFLFFFLPPFNLSPLSLTSARILAACASSFFVASGISDSASSDPDMFSVLSARARRVVALME